MSWHHVFDAARAAFPGCILNDDASGRIKRFAPNPDKPHKKDGYIVLFPDGAGVIGDFKSGYQEYVRAHAERLTAGERRKRMADAARERDRMQREQMDTWERRAAINQEIWDSAEDIGRKTPAGCYLDGRGVYFKDLHHALRWTPKLAYYGEDKDLVGHFPAMLGAVTNVTGTLIAVHRTYLDGLGGKAPVPTPKKLTRASGPVAGCSIKLGAPTEQKGRRCIGVAEGIETALACRTLFHLPTVSAISAHGIARLQWPPDAQRIYVFADNDVHWVGQKSANNLATRAQLAGLSAKVLVPNNKGEDWADVLETRLATE